MTNLPFIQLITEHRQGDLEADLSRRLLEVLEGIREYGGKGKLTLSLGFSLDKHGMVSVDAKTDHKAPEKGVKPAVYWLTDDLTLTRSDPRQRDLEDIDGVRQPQGPARLASVEI